MRRIFSGLAVLMLTVGIAGCEASVSAGDKKVSKADVETKAETTLQQQVGSSTPPNITCPDDLKAKVGTTMICTLQAGSDPATYNVTLTVDSVNGSDAHFNIQVADKPNP